MTNRNEAVPAANQVVERVDCPGMKRPGNDQVQETDHRRMHGSTPLFYTNR